MVIQLFVFRQSVYMCVLQEVIILKTIHIAKQFNVQLALATNYSAI